MELSVGKGIWCRCQCQVKVRLIISDVGTNRIDLFQRVPSDLRKYLEYKERIIASHGSILRFIIKERLRWGEGAVEDLKPKGRPFECNGSYHVPCPGCVIVVADRGGLLIHRRHQDSV